MITDEQITALAREYAEECIDPYGFSKDAYEEIVEEKAENVAYVLRWLSTRFYLADKEKAKAFYRGETFGELDFIELVSSRRILSSLFPEIAKEVKG